MDKEYMLCDVELNLFVLLMDKLFNVACFWYGKHGLKKSH